MANINLRKVLMQQVQNPYLQKVKIKEGNLSKNLILTKKN